MNFDDPNHRLYATVEHLLPKSEGGQNNKENLRFAHKSCNNARHGRNFIKVKNDTLKASREYAKKITAEKIRQAKARLEEEGQA